MHGPHVQRLQHPTARTSRPHIPWLKYRTHLATGCVTRRWVTWIYLPSQTSWLYSVVIYLVDCWDVGQLDRLSSHLLADVVVVHVDVFRPTEEDWIWVSKVSSLCFYLFRGITTRNEIIHTEYEYVVHCTIISLAVGWWDDIDDRMKFTIQSGALGTIKLLMGYHSRSNEMGCTWWDDTISRMIIGVRGGSCCTTSPDHDVDLMYAVNDVNGMYWRNMRIHNLYQTISFHAL